MVCRPLVGGDLAGVDVVIAFGVAEPAIAAGFLHAHQTPPLIVFAHLNAHSWLSRPTDARRRTAAGADPLNSKVLTVDDDVGELRQHRAGR